MKNADRPEHIITLGGSDLESMKCSGESCQMAVEFEWNSEAVKVCMVRVTCAFCVTLIFKMYSRDKC